MSSKEVLQSTDLGQIKPNDLMDAIEVKAINKYPPPNMPYGQKRTDKLPEIDSMTIAHELLKRMPKMTIDDIDNYLVWLKAVKGNIAPNQDEALNNLLAAFAQMKEAKITELKNLRGEVASEIDDITHQS
jgi:hypothetical protein